MHRIEAVALAEHVSRRLRRAADAAELGDAVRRQRQLEAGAHDRRADRIVAAAGAERRHRPFVVAMGEAERIHFERRVMELRLGEIAHETASTVLFAARLRQPGGDFADDEAGGDRHPAVMGDRRSAAPDRGRDRPPSACASARRGSARRRTPARAPARIRRPPGSAGRRGCAARRHRDPARPRDRWLRPSRPRSSRNR